MTRNAAQPSRFFVVDANSDDYRDLSKNEECPLVQMVHFRSGREALRSNPDESPVMWIINLRLPDMEGTMLHDMLRSRGCRRPIALVGDEYRMEDELEARSAGASFYLAKPLCTEFLAASC